MSLPSTVGISRILSTLANDIMEIFVRQYDEGTGLAIAYDYEQATLHRQPPSISPSPLTADQSIADFNARMQQALSEAMTEAPENLPIEHYIEVLGNIGG